MGCELPSTQRAAPRSHSSCPLRSADNCASCTRRPSCFVAAWSWHGTTSAAVSISTSLLPCPHSSPSCDGRCTNNWSRSRMSGTSASVARNGFPQSWPPLLRAVMRPANNDRHPCCCVIQRTTTTACTRIYMDRLYFPCRWPCCCRHRVATLLAASSCSPNNGHACNHASKWSTCVRETRWFLRPTNVL